MCKSLVGRPINEAFSAPLHQASSDSHAYITCIDGRYDRPPDDYGCAGCYPGRRWDKRWAPQKPTAMFSFGADDGTYFGRLGGVLHFKPGGVSERVMCHLTGGHARHCGTWWQWH